MKKILNNKLFFIVFAAILFMINVGDAFAADQSIVCDNSGCSGLSGSLFSEAGILPGNNVIRSVDIINNSDNTLKVGFEITKNINTDNNFVNIVELKVDKDSASIFNGAFSNIFSNKLDLGSLNSGKSTTISFNLLLPLTAGNEYQNKSADFDISFYLEGDDGDSQVLSTDDSNNFNNESLSNTKGEVLGTTGENDLIDKVLGLSNTNSGKFLLSVIFGGFILMIIGSSFILTSFKKSDQV